MKAMQNRREFLKITAAGSVGMIVLGATDVKAKIGRAHV